jgi:cytochrome c5
VKSSIIALLFLLGSTIVIVSSCTKKVAFTHPIKPWFDKTCGECHFAGADASASWIYDPTDYNTSIKKNIHHLHEHVCVTKTMPPGGCTASEMAIFQAWYDAGFPSK